MRHPNRQKRQRFPVSAWRFREARLQCGLGVDACADLLRISDRTVRNWESGAVRIPYAAYKLMRILRGGKLLGPEWRNFFVRGSTLVTPEGRRLECTELGWWSLLVLQAQQWRNLFAEQNGREPTSVASSMLAHCKAPRVALRSKRKANPAVAHGKSQSGPKLTPETGTFHQPGRATMPSDRDPFPVGPSSNTGQKSAQIQSGVPA